MTRYPLEIDSALNIPEVVDNFSAVNAVTINRLRAAIIAVEHELGLKPSGTYGTVRERLDALVAGSGSSGGSAPGGSAREIQYRIDGYTLGGVSKVQASLDSLALEFQTNNESVATTGNLRSGVTFEINSGTSNKAVVKTLFSGGKNYLYNGISFGSDYIVDRGFNQSFLVGLESASVQTVNNFGVASQGTAVIPTGAGASPYFMARPNLYIGKNAPGPSTDPFNGGSGVLMFNKVQSLPTANPSSDWSYIYPDSVSGHLMQWLPNGTILDLAASGASPGGTTRTVQFNAGSGSFDGASKVFISTDGNMEMPTGGTAVATRGNVRTSADYEMVAKFGSKEFNIIHMMDYGGNGTGTGAACLNFGVGLSSGLPGPVNPNFDPDKAAYQTVVGSSDFTSLRTINYVLDGSLRVTSQLSAVRPSNLNYSPYTRAQPNLYIGTTNPSDNGFGGGYGLSLYGDVTTMPSIAPVNGFFLWSDITTHEPYVMLPGSTTVKNILPQGDGYSIQYKDPVTGALAGAANLTVSSSGFLEIAKSRIGSIPSVGDIRGSRYFSITSMPAYSSDPANYLTIMNAFGANTDKEFLALGGPSNGTHTFNFLTGYAKSGIYWYAGDPSTNGGDYHAGINIIGQEGSYNAAQSYEGVYLSSNIAIQGDSRTMLQSGSSFHAGGKGYLWIEDRFAARTGSLRSTGFGIWSNPSNHHPMVTIGNTDYDLFSGIGGSAPGADGYSVQYNKDGYFAGASNVFISPDGYLQVKRTAKSLTNPTNSVNIYADNSDGYLKYHQSTGNVITLSGDTTINGNRYDLMLKENSKTLNPLLPSGGGVLADGYVAVRRSNQWVAEAGASVPDGYNNDIIGLDGLGGLKNLGAVASGIGIRVEVAAASMLDLNAKPSTDRVGQFSINDGYAGDVHVRSISNGQSKHWLIIYNDLSSPANIIIDHENTAATASNRIQTSNGENYILPHLESILLFRDVGTSTTRWRIVNGSSSSGEANPTGTPKSLAVYDDDGNLGYRSGLTFFGDATNEVLNIPRPIKPFSDYPFRLAAKVITLTAGASAFTPTPGSFGWGRLHAILQDEEEEKPYIWVGFDTLDSMSLVSVYSPANTGSILFKHASDATTGATVLAGETVWLAFNGTRIVRTGGDPVADPPPEEVDTGPGTIITVNPASLPLTAYWGPGYTGSPHAGTASAGTSGSHNATALSNVPGTSTLNGIPIMTLNGTNQKLDGYGTLADYITNVNENFTVIVMFKAPTLEAPSGVIISDPAILSVSAGAWSVHVSSEGFGGFIQTVAGPRQAIAPCAANVWNTGVITYDGYYIKAGVNGPPSVSTACSAPTNIEAIYRNLQLFRNYDQTKWFGGSIARILIADSVISDDNISGVIAFWNDLFGTSM